MVEKYVEVLESYECEVKSVRRGRGAWIFDTDRGMMQLAEYRGTMKRLDFESEVLTGLLEMGICTDKMIPNKKGELLTKAQDGTAYLMKNWLEERECNLKDAGELCRVAGQIGFLHRMLAAIPFKEEWNMGSSKSLPVSVMMEKRNREMKRAKKYILRKKKRSLFEQSIMETFDEFYDQALSACRRHREENLDEGRSRFLCHGALNQHHILVGMSGITFTGFSRLHEGEQMEDVYHFLRKVMEKNGWNISMGIDILAEYAKQRSIGSQDKRILESLFAYPEKYWKQINFYFNTNKAWVPEKNVEKIHMMAGQEAARQKFIQYIKSW